MKIGFFGTPELAATLLQDFLQDPTFEISYIVSQPDKPTGREQYIIPSPVSKVALDHDIPLFRPEKIRWNSELISTLSLFLVDYIVVVAYGKILPQEILDLPQSLCINIHGSLLPAYRGASPIQSALLDGVSITGVTIMEMSLGMDEGDILRTLEIPIDPEETAHSLFEKFGVLCGPLCRSTLQDHRAGKIIPIAQGAGATYTKKFTKEDGYIDISQHTAAEIYRRYQAFFPWPGIWTTIKDRRCKILRLAHPDTPPSTGVCVPTRWGNIEILEIQFDGKKPTPATSELLHWFFR